MRRTDEPRLVDEVGPRMETRRTLWVGDETTYVLLTPEADGLSLDVEHLGETVFSRELLSWELLDALLSAAGVRLVEG